MRSVIAVFFLTCAAPSRAAVEVYSADKLAQLQEAGRTILVQFDAAGCGVCQAQGKALAQLAAEPLPAPAVLRAVFDDAEDLRKRYGVTAPSTLLLFKGGDLLGRAAGLTSLREMRRFLHEHRSRYRFRPGARSPRPILPKR